MSNYSSLKATINANIKTNGNQEITGAVLNSVLRTMVSSLGAGYQFCGVASSLSYDPGTPDFNGFWLAGIVGTYTNFGNLSVSDGEIAALVWNGSWTKLSCFNINDYLITKTSLGAQLSGGGETLQSITKNGAQATIAFKGDICIYGNGSSGNAFKVFSTTGQSYTLPNLSVLVADFSSGSLQVVSASSTTQMKSAVGASSKVIVASCLWGYVFSPIPSLQTEFDHYQFHKDKDIEISETTPSDYTTTLRQNGVDHVVANSKLFLDSDESFGFSSKTGGSSAAQGIGMPISKSGVLSSVYVNVAEDATATIQIYTANFASVRKTMTFPVSAGANTLTINENVSAGEFVVVNGVKAFFANDSSFEQIFWYDYGGNTGWALRSDHIKWSCGYVEHVYSLIGQIQAAIEQLESMLTGEIQYVPVVVTRNAADYNSIRETMAGISDASYYKRYVLVVPSGRWFECDIQGKKYVYILGEDKYKTILYCDGTSSKLTPSDYSFPTYAGQALSSIGQAYKHIINARQDIHVEGVSFEVNDCKYCCHLDSTAYKNAYFKDCKFTEMNANVTFVCGLGTHAGQKHIFDGCEFYSHESKTDCVYVHNWNNLTDINEIDFVNCKFNKNYFLYDELGSDYSTFVRLNNCYTTKSNPVLTFRTITTQGHSYWIDPSTGEPITDMTQLPYCTFVNIIGTEVHHIVEDGTRPDIEDYIVGKIG